MGGPYSNLTGVLIRREHLDTKETAEMHRQRKDHVRTRRKAAMCKPRREASEEIEHADTLILDFQPPEL